MFTSITSPTTFFSYSLGPCFLVFDLQNSKNFVCILINHTKLTAYICLLSNDLVIDVIVAIIIFSDYITAII